MPRLRLPLIAVSGALAATLSLAACTSSKDHDAKGTSSPSAAAGSNTAAGTPVAPATLAATLQKGLSSATSVHLAIVAAISGETVRGSGDAALHDGTVDKAAVTQGLPGGLGTIQLVTLGDTTYAKLPSALAQDKSKPWVKLSTSSGDVVVAQLARSVSPILAIASPAALVPFSRDARSASRIGTASVAGTTTTHYRVEIDPTKLPAGVPSGIAGTAATLPVDVYVDSTGRPRQVHGTFSISGQSVTPTITLSDYNAPVTVTAPPASQIASD